MMKEKLKTPTTKFASYTKSYMSFFSPLNILIAFAMGILPALLWLWFWLHEDSLHPEPKKIIIITFIVGMLATIPALFGESYVCGLFTETSSAGNFLTNIGLGAANDFKIDCIGTSFVGNLALLVVILWVVIEEVVKFGAVYVSALWRKENNEPIDSLIYFITGALGFSAAENSLYLLSALSTDGSAIQSIVLGNFRFLGATLLHTVSTGAIGLALALSYFKPRWLRSSAVIIGVIIAIALHTMFNLFILRSDDGNFLATFGFVWLASIVLLLFFEKVKVVHQKYYSTEPITPTL